MTWLYSSGSLYDCLYVIHVLTHQESLSGWRAPRRSIGVLFGFDDQLVHELDQLHGACVRPSIAQHATN